MPGRISGRKRRSTQLEEDDNESLADYSSQPVASSVKRARVNDHEDEEVRATQTADTSLS